MVDSTLSHYRIIDELGRGGMGIVYLAEDTKLDRKVAIKVLPPSALAGEDDRARFYREAKAAAALNHPNIAQIYQIDEAVPSDAPHGTQPSPFIAMEYIDGETLDARIKRGPLKLAEAVKLAIQIAGALGEAHDKGIVHRDVKASNVMLTSKGDTKVLDFGLALTAASTKLTRMGSTLGTVAYMSPEQARGEEVDRRTDLWALGVVLYEMIAGRTPFGGDYEQAALYSILNADPEPLTAVRTGVPMQLEWTVDKLLAKDADLRYQTAAGLVADLKALDLSGSGQSRRSMSTASAATLAGARAASDGRRVRRWLPAVIGGIMLALGIVLGALLYGGGSAGHVDQASILADLVLDQGHEDYPVLSEDGRYLAFEGTEPSNAVYLKDLESGAVRQISAGGSPRSAAFSPDGRWLVWLQQGTIWKAATASGVPVNLGINCRSPVFVDAERFVCKGTGESDYPLSIVRSDLNGNVSEPVLAPDSTAGIGDLVLTDVLPGGRFAVGSIYPVDDDAGDRRLGVFDLEKGTVVSLDQKGFDPRYVASGHLLFQASIDAAGYGPLMARPFDADRREFTGPAVPVPGEQLMRYQFDVTESGLFIWGIHPHSLDRYEFEWWDVSGERLERLPVEPDDYEFADLSPDGRRLAVKLEDDPNSKQDIWIIEVESGARYRFSFTEDADFPVWSAVGASVYMVADFEGVRDALVVKSADTAGNPTIVLDDVSDVRRPHVARNNGAIVFEKGFAGAIEVRSLSNPDSVRIIDREGGVLLYHPALSNDGMYVAFELRTPERTQIFVQQSWGDAFWALPTTSDQESAWRPKWSHDGRWLYYRTDRLWRTRVRFDPTFRAEGPEMLFELPDRTVDYLLHPDGERVLLHRAVVSDKEESSGPTRLSLRFNLGRLLDEIAPPSDRS